MTTASEAIAKSYKCMSPTAPVTPTSVIVLYEQNLETQILVKITKIIPGVCDVESYQTHASIADLLKSYDVVFVDIKIPDLLSWWISQRVYIPGTSHVLFLKNHGDSTDIDAVKRDLAVDFVVKDLSVPAVGGIAEFALANSMDYVRRSIVLKRGVWKQIMNALTCLIKCA